MALAAVTVLDAATQHSCASQAEEGSETAIHGTNEGATVGLEERGRIVLFRLYSEIRDFESTAASEQMDEEQLSNLRSILKGLLDL